MAQHCDNLKSSLSNYSVWSTWSSCHRDNLNALNSLRTVALQGCPDSARQAVSMAGLGPPQASGCLRSEGHLLCQNTSADASTSQNKHIQSY